MTLACQGLNLVKPLVVLATPFIPELRGDIDYKAEKQTGIIDLPLPTINVGDLALSGSANDNPKAVVFSGKVSVSN
jgi:hypothetical protein